MIVLFTLWQVVSLEAAYSQRVKSLMYLSNQNEHTIYFKSRMQYWVNLILIQVRVSAFHVSREAVSVKPSPGFPPDRRMSGSFGSRGGGILIPAPGELSVAVNTPMRSTTPWWGDARPEVRQLGFDLDILPNRHYQNKFNSGLSINFQSRGTTGLYTISAVDKLKKKL